MEKKNAPKDPGKEQADIIREPLVYFNQFINPTLIIMTNINLSDCKLISSTEYLTLENPEFKGQTRLDENNMYYMVFESKGILYKIHNKL